MEERMQMPRHELALRTISRQPATAPSADDQQVQRELREQVAQLQEMLFTTEEQHQKLLRERRLQEQRHQLTLTKQKQLVAELQQANHQYFQLEQQATAQARLHRALVIRQLLVEADRLVNRWVNPGWTHNYPTPMLGPPPWVTAWYNQANGRMLLNLEREDLIVIFRTTADSLRGKGNKAAHTFTVHDQAAAVRAMAGTVHGASLKRIFKFVHGRSPYSP